MGAELTDKKHIFNTAAEITDPTERAKYLDEICGGDTQFRAEIEDLLRHDIEAGSFLERPIVGERPTEILNALTDREGLPDPPADEVSLDFLKPCDVPGRLGMLGPYEVIEVIGKGGMGVVLRAHDTKLNRVVAVKVLAPEFAANPTARKRFLREAQAAAAISHPHVVSIHAVDEAENTPYLVMECIDGLSLQDKIERVGHLKLKEILRIGSQIASGLAAAHNQGLIHRDVKPGNILLENGVERVKITDFGLARAVDDVSVTRTGDVAGTPLFMSPEQAQAKPLDHRSDLFSLGCVLYAMCTGRSPFRAETTVAVLRRVCDDTPRPIREIHPEIPETLVAIIERLLAKDLDERFQTAQEVADVLGQHLAYLQYPTKTPRGPVDVAKGTLAEPGPGEHAFAVDEASAPRRSHSRRRPWVAAALVLLALVGSLGITEATGVTHLAATVIRIATGEGTLVIEVDDPTVKVSIDGEGISISGAGVKELRLRPGEYQFRAMKDGKPIKTELVTISRGGRVAVKVTIEPPLLPDTVSRQTTPPTPWHELLEPGAPPPPVSPFDAQQARQHQEAWAKYLGAPVEITNSIDMKFVLIPPGEFDMGSSKEERDEVVQLLRKWNWPQSYVEKVLGDREQQHRVAITHPFYLGQCEVDVGQFGQFVNDIDYRTTAETNGFGKGLNPQTGNLEGGPEYSWRNAFPQQTDQHPVVNVTWDDAAAFCQWLSRKEKKQYRLPSEAEWEYTCRAGTTTWHCSGGDRRSLGDYAWLRDNSFGSTHPVGQKKPNQWGLYDVQGNVWEWCADWCSSRYYQRSPRCDPTGPATSPQRVFRGASFMYGSWDPLKMRCAYRHAAPPHHRDPDLGFRVLCEVTRGDVAIRPAPPDPSENPR